jgi:hypothetical protein
MKSLQSQTIDLIDFKHYLDWYKNIILSSSNPIIMVESISGIQLNRYPLTVNLILAASIPEAYKVKGTPDIEIVDVLFPLRA